MAVTAVVAWRSSETVWNRNWAAAARALAVRSSVRLIPVVTGLGLAIFNNEAVNAHCGLGPPNAALVAKTIVCESAFHMVFDKHFRFWKGIEDLHRFFNDVRLRLVQPIAIGSAVENKLAKSVCHES
jgi:hypothetical protein